MVKNVGKLLFQAMVFLMTHLPTNVSLTSFFIVRQHFTFLSFLKINIFRNDQKCVEKLVLALRFVTLRRFQPTFHSVLEGCPARTLQNQGTLVLFQLLEFRGKCDFSYGKIFFLMIYHSERPDQGRPTLSPNLKTIGSL